MDKVHAERPFKQILKIDSRQKDAIEMVKEIGKLFTIEKKWRNWLLTGVVSRPEFLIGRREESLKVIADIYKLADQKRGNYAPRSQMGKAFNFLYTYRPGLSVYLDCLEASPHNNDAEAAIRPYCVGKHNWLFCKSVDGADASALIFSLIESAKLEGLNPYDYLELVFTFGPDCRTEEDWEQLLPENADISRLEYVRSQRANATPDEHRERPYLFTGLTGQVIRHILTQPSQP